MGFGLKPSPWLSLPVFALELLVYTSVSAYIPDIMTDFFDGSYSKASIVSGVADSIGALLSFLLSATVGAYSDRQGRRFYLILMVLGASMPEFMLAFYPYLNLWAFFAAKIFGKFTSAGVVMSYIADLTTKEERSKAFAYMMGVMGVTVCVGPLIVLVADAQWAFRVSAILGVLNVAYIYFVLPESVNSAESIALLSAKPLVAVTEESALNASEGLVVPQTQTSDPSLSSSTSSSSSFPPPPPLQRQQSLNPFLSIQYLTQSRRFIVLSLIVFFSQMSENGIVETSLLYLKDELDFDPTDNVILLIGVGVCTTLVMFFLLPCLLKRVSERRLMTVALMFDCIHVCVYIVARQHWQVYLVVIPASLGFMSYPSSSSLLSKWVPAEQQGVALGALTGVKSLTLGLGPLSFSGIFSLFTSDYVPFQFPQAPFCLGALCLLTAVLIAIFGFRGEDTDFDIEGRRGSYARIKDSDENVNNNDNNDNDNNDNNNTDKSSLPPRSPIIRNSDIPPASPNRTTFLRRSPRGSLSGKGKEDSVYGSSVNSTGGEGRGGPLQSD